MKPALSADSIARPPAYSRAPVAPRPMSSMAFMARAPLRSFGADFSELRKDALRDLDATCGNAAFRGQVELHLAGAREPLLHLAHVRARFALEAFEVTSHRVEVSCSPRWGNLGAACKQCAHLGLRAPQPPIADVKAFNLRDEPFQPLAASCRHACTRPQPAPRAVPRRDARSLDARAPAARRVARDRTVATRPTLELPHTHRRRSSRRSCRLPPGCLPNTRGRAAAARRSS